MNDLLSTEELRGELTAHLDAVTPPPGDLAAVKRRSRQLRMRRLAGPGLLAAAAVGVGALVLSQTSAPAPPDRGGAGPATSVAGPVDLSHGLRAFASPGDRIYMAGQSLPNTIEYLDTDAAATPYGIVFPDADGRPWLLRPDGKTVQLDDHPSEAPSGWHPTIKADAQQPVVAYALLHDGEVTVKAYDLEKRSVIASVDITCDGGCSDLVIDGVDSGAVFIRTPKGTHVWDYERQESFDLAGPKTRIADVRNKTVLFDGPAPAGLMDGWLFVPGPVDAQLSYDGKYVLNWSDTLQPTVNGRGEPITLDLPVKAAQFTFDTDGSVLAATSGNPAQVFDCEIHPGPPMSSGSAGPCEQIGEMPTDHGDPTFIGNDM